VRFVTFDEVAARLRGKTVAVVGSAPSVMENAFGLIDSHEVVVRVNNYKLGSGAGLRADVHYSFYGNSIRKSAAALTADGVQLCMCKCPNSKPISSAWHVLNNKPEGVDFRYIYKNRAAWWFCDTWVPSDEEFLAQFQLLGGHIPTTGFAALFDVLRCGSAEVYLTGFDFFSSGKHNVNEPWKPGREDDPIGHQPDLEREWLSRNKLVYPLKFDGTLSKLLGNGDSRHHVEAHA
jgi:hypothetical protein